jgi:thiamine-phosphate pyrophosphorylase
MKPNLGRLHVLTDTFLQTKYSHVDLARMAIDGGADTIQFRQKSGSSLEMFRNAEKIMMLCRDANVTLIVDDRIDIGYAVDADGVHLGQSDIPLPIARKLLGKTKLIGGSATDFDELQKVIDGGADYVGFGPVFGTMSKENPGTPKGIQFMKEVRERSPIPVIAIGGIKLQHVEELFSTGIHGIAVISAICCEPDPVAATKEFIEKIQYSVKTS